MHSANRTKKMAKFEPWWWNWKLEAGPGGGQAAIPWVINEVTPDSIDILTSSHWWRQRVRNPHVDNVRSTAPPLPPTVATILMKCIVELDSRSG
ncbi:hypothetical protein EVAR_83316_1 [Eumeta japonica]|uniref:Uncharacterized protein n=1 Tax=Eumeta variegata TaxID=151549 RepID=A0A4C1VX58_EUMVA|nr:hypothetical protein EVAR_83316_1 [Eumeta japonica]